MTRIRKLAVSTITILLLAGCGGESLQTTAATDSSSNPSTETNTPNSSISSTSPTSTSPTGNTADTPEENSTGQGNDNTDDTNDGTPPNASSPTVLSTTPADTSTGAGTQSTVSARFSEMMKASTFTAATFTLREGANVIPGDVTGNGVIGIFTPSSPLSANTTYTATITTAVTDADGNPLAANKVWSFTTGTALDTTGPLVTLQSPPDRGRDVTIDSVVSVTFNELVDPSTITTTTFSMHDDGFQNIAGTVSYNAATRVATFTPSSPLNYGRGYSPTLTTDIKDTSGNAFEGGVPWGFVTIAFVDTTPPTVTLTNPLNGATGVATNQKMRVTFSEVIDPATVTITSFSLTGPSGLVSGSVAYDAVNRAATFTPTSALAPNSAYTGTVAVGIRDVAGNALASAVNWDFTTGGSTDNTQPSIVSISPTDGTTGVALDSPLTVTLNEDADCSSATTTTFSLQRTGDSPLPGTVTCNGSTLTFTPDAFLWGNTGHTAIITTGITDLAGNALSAGLTWTFATAP
ncbi:MAG: Ig-like domain-containing protein [Deltaproteobacteria bacterium]|nr:Ig-like domain-containing protein [Deltaproteobacteria bacterium]